MMAAAEVDQTHSAELADVLDVGSHAGHQLPGLGPVVIAERQPVQFVEQVVAQVESDALADLLRKVALEEGEDPAHQSQPEERGGGDRHPPPVAPLYPLVDEQPDELWRDQGEPRHRQNRAESAGDARGMGPQVAERPAQFGEGDASAASWPLSRRRPP